MKLFQKNFQDNQRVFDEIIDTSDKLILHVNFVEAIEGGRAARLYGNNYTIAGYSCKEGKNIYFVLNFASPSDGNIEMALTAVEAISLYHVMSSIKEGFSNRFEMVEPEQGIELVLQRSLHQEYMFLIQNEYHSYKIISDDAMLYKQILFVLNYVLTSEPKEYVETAKDAFAYIERIKKIHDKNSIPEVILRDTEFRSILRSVGIDLCRVPMAIEQPIINPQVKQQYTEEEDNNDEKDN